MIIKKVIIENFLCYYGVKRFELENGLNIFLGENGEGKTKFFEALQWLFGANSEDLSLLVSKKAISEKVEGENIRVRVEIVVDHYDEVKILTKEFTVQLLNDGELSYSKPSMKGIVELKNGERNFVDGKSLLDILFPSEIRRYSMFKGEEELNIFNNEDALINLINLFSDAKHFQKYESTGAFLKLEAQKAVNKESRRNNKNAEEYKKIEESIKYFERLKATDSEIVEELERSIEKTEKNIEQTEKYINNAEALEILNDRIKKIEKEISQAQGLISENYTTSLFDENWILMNFKDIHKQFTKKVSYFSKQKRKLQHEFDVELGIKEGEKRAKLQIINDLVPLPENVPSLEIMKEMVDDKVCKVCNRPAEEGSEALDFMRKRLENYLQSQTVEQTEQEEVEKLFNHNYADRLVNLSTNQEDNLLKLNNIDNEIRDLFQFNQTRKDRISRLNDKLEDEIKERNRIIGNSSVGSERLGVVLKDYNSWQRDIKESNKELIVYQEKIKKYNTKLNELRKEKDRIDLTNANSFLIKSRDILKDIEDIFRDTKEKKFNEFIELLSEKSNDIFSKINVDAFTGIIEFRTVKSSNNRVKVKIKLIEEDGSVFHSPNQSLITSMHISILLAISELSKEVRDNKYPMVFDAPTSSFGESKMTEFLNLIFESDNQTLILIKDYIAKDENRDLFIKPEFKKVKRHKAFWIKLERPFEKNNLKTINAQRIEL